MSVEDVSITKGRRPRLLIISFSGIANDGRVMRQIDEFVRDFDIVTCGGGPKPHPDVEHVQVEFSVPKWFKHVQALCLHTRRYRLAYWLTPYLRKARRALKGTRFDAVLANDLTAAGVAAAVAPSARTLLDLHEYWTGIHDDVEAWRKLRIPYHDWLLRTYAAPMRSHTTVSHSIAQRYRQEYGFSCEVVANASVYRDFSPQPVQQPLRLVHSGIAKPARRIEVMMGAVAASRDATLDLYLTGVGGDYYRELEALSEELGDRVRIVPPVPHSELLETLNRYDVGLPFLPPTTTNIRLCLPNKFFDYVQARLAMVTGPTEAMAELAVEHRLGVVTESFEQEDLTRAIDALTPDSVAEYKRNADAAAEDLSGEHQIAVWRAEIERIVREEGV